MFKVFRDKSLTNSIDSQIKKRSVYSGAIKLKSLAVLIDARKDIDVILLAKLADELGVKPFNLSIMGLKELKSDRSIEVKANTNYFDEKMIGYANGFKTEALAKFVNTPYDVLINFYDKDNSYLNLVASSSKAKFKVGFVDVDNRINDLVIGTPPDNKDLFISELKKYLKILTII